MDSALARNNMVSSQVAPNNVHDPALLASLRQVRREEFVAAPQRGFAYSDLMLALPSAERKMLKPVQQGRLIDALGVTAGYRVLVVGAGTGYEAAVLAGMGARVFALESAPELVAVGRAQLSGANISWREAPLEQGWPEESPFDGILVCGAVAAVSNKLIGQLGRGGRLVAIVGKPGSQLMRAVRMVGISGADKPEVLFNTAAAQLPGFELAEVFEL